MPRACALRPAGRASAAPGDDDATHRAQRSHSVLTCGPAACAGTDRGGPADWRAVLPRNLEETTLMAIPSPVSDCFLCGGPADTAIVQHPKSRRYYCLRGGCGEYRITYDAIDLLVRGPASARTRLADQARSAHAENLALSIDLARDGSIEARPIPVDLP